MDQFSNKMIQLVSNSKDKHFSNQILVLKIQVGSLE